MTRSSLVSSTERDVPPVSRRLRTRGTFAVSDTVTLFALALTELAVVDDAVEAVTERDTSEAVAGFAVDTFVEPVPSEATAVVDDVAADEVGAELVALVEAGAVEAGAELVALVEAGASELTATLDATELVGATDVAVTVSVAAGATVAVAALSGAVLGEVVATTPSP